MQEKRWIEGDKDGDLIGLVYEDLHGRARRASSANSGLRDPHDATVWNVINRSGGTGFRWQEFPLVSWRFRVRPLIGRDFAR